MAASPIKVTYFESIPVVPDHELIMRRLGYKKGRTSLGADDVLFINSSIQAGLSLCRNRGAAGRFMIKSRTVETIILSDGTAFESRRLAKLLSDSEEIILMAGTAGREITGRISSGMSEGNAARAVVFDAVGSESADMILDWIMDLYSKILVREGRKLTSQRFSPGYGDLHLSGQADIYRLLGLERLGLELTGSMILIPEKSVLAIAGIERVK